MKEQTPKVEIFGSNLSQAQREEAEKQGINLADPNHLIIMIPNQGFSLRKTPKPLSEYGNGLIKMHIISVLKKLPAGSQVVNFNLTEKVKSIKPIVKRGRKPKNPTEA